MIKFSSPLSVQYILVSDGTNYTDSSFYVNSFNLLRTLPIEIIQLENSVNHFEFCFRFKAIKTYELFTLPSIFFDFDVEIVVENLDAYSKNFGVQSLIRVFLIDGIVKNHNVISNVFKKISHCYYTLIDDTTGKFSMYSANNIFRNANEFIKLVNRDLEKIEGELHNIYKNDIPPVATELRLEINPNKTFISENIEPGSILAWNNYFVLNQIIGNFWLGINDKIGIAQIEPNERGQELITQCEKIDSIYSILYNNVGIKPTDPFQPIYPSLVLVLPYHYPKIEKLLGKKFSKQEKLWRSILGSEQNLIYQHEIPEHDENNISMKEIAFIMASNSLRLQYLDNIAFLHSMFTYSPVIRLPQIGKSINRDLSHLEKITPKKQSTISNIEKFGKKLSTLTLSQNLQQYINGRNGQIFAISDLPIEWLYINDYPLCFTHDVCRLPEFNLNSLVNNAIHLQRYLYQIPTDLIDKTLVIHCASKNEQFMNHMFSLIDKEKEKLGFKSVKCGSVLEISQAIKKFKPELLIFDCHGTSNKNDLSSNLVIDGANNVYLTGNDIVEHRISAPLVFLSACETFPNYGYVKLLSDAFMEAGAYCVTTTFFPIKIIDAATVIIRLLNNLNQLKFNSYHMNWLNFLSHILRSSLIYETFNKARNHLIEEITTEEISKIVTKSMKFEYRIEALEELESLIKNRSNKQIKFHQLDNEWLSYSIIGRADLIYFENWITAFKDINS